MTAFVAIPAGRPLQAMPSRGAGNIECGEGTPEGTPARAILRALSRPFSVASRNDMIVLRGHRRKTQFNPQHTSHLPIVTLPNAPMPIGIITLKNRTLTPLAQLYVDNVRAIAKPLAKLK
ncbi:MAG: hypothetical protein ACXU84_20580 [Xanthobacteraceae bacterium]